MTKLDTRDALLCPLYKSGGYKSAAEFAMAAELGVVRGHNKCTFLWREDEDTADYHILSKSIYLLACGQEFKNLFPVVLKETAGTFGAGTFGA
jgi:hypothetical protein